MKILTLLCLAPFFCNAQALQVGVNSGLHFRYSDGTTQGGPAAFLSAHVAADAHKWQLGGSISIYRIRQVEYWHTYIPPHGSNDRYVTVYIANPGISPTLFFNKKWDFKKRYLYAGPTVGLLFNPFHQGKNNTNNYYYPSYTGFVWQVQVGYSEKVAKRTVFNVELGLRNTRIDTKTRSINQYSRPISVGMRWQLTSGREKKKEQRKA